VSTAGKNHRPKEIDFDTLTALSFDPITLAFTQATTAIQATIPVPCNFKIFYIATALTGSVAGTCSVNVVAGVGAEGAATAADTIAVSGNKVITDAALTMTTNTVQRFQATNFDGIYPTTLPLTVRTLTNGSAAGTLKVTVIGKYVDPNPSKPLFNTSGVLSF
jgi:hypothetical protein